MTTGKIVHRNKNAAVSGGGGSRDLLLSDLPLQGFFGQYSDGMYGEAGINGAFAASEAFTVRYVGGVARLVTAANHYAGTGLLNPSWHTQDIWECTIPSSLSSTPANATTGIFGNYDRFSSTYESSRISGRRWDWREWMTIGAYGHNGVHIGQFMMDPVVSNRLWYTMQGNYSNGPIPFIAAVDLLDTAGTYGLACTKYGPWHARDWNTVNASWKELCMRITEIPASERSNFSGKHYLFGADTTSQSSYYQPGGLSLVALDLPSVTGRTAIDGRGESDNIGASDGYTVYIYRADSSLLSGVATDGTMCIFFDHPAQTAGTATWQQYATITAKTYDSGNGRWVVTCVPTVLNGAGTSTPMTVMAGGSPRRDWAINFLVPSSDIVPVAQYSLITGLDLEDYRADRMDSELSFDAHTGHSFVDDLYFGTRTNVIFGSGRYPVNGIAAHRGRPALSGSLSTVELQHDSSSVTGAYTNLLLYNHTTGELKTIAGYDGSTKIVTISGSFSAAVVAGTLYTLVLPSDFTITSATSNTITFPAGVAPVANNGVMLDLLVSVRNNIPTGIITHARRITAWNGTTRTATLDAAWAITPTSSTEVTLFSYWGTGYRRFTCTASSSSTIQLPIGASSVDDAYNGLYIRDVDHGNALCVYDYVGATRTCTMGPMTSGFGGYSTWPITPTVGVTNLELQVWDPNEWAGSSVSATGKFNLNMDMAIGMAAIKTPTINFCVFSPGRKCIAGVWYHGWDNYAFWDILAGSDYSPSANGFSYHSQLDKAAGWLQKGSELRAAVADSSLANSTGVKIYDIGDWRATYGPFPPYGNNVAFPDVDVICHITTSYGAGGGVVVDKVGNRMIIGLRYQYSDAHTLYMVLGLPSGME